MDFVPEVEAVQEIIDKTIENYKMCKKLGQLDEAKIVKDKLREIKYAKEHLVHVMNLDFTRPTDKMKQMALKANINLSDPNVIEEFKLI